MSEYRVIEQSDAVASHLAHCCGEIYRTLGAAAPTFHNDAVVVVAYEVARACGSLRHQFDELRARRAVVPSFTNAIPEIGDVLERAVARDPSGTFALFVVATVVTPRLLVTLRDVVASASDVAEGPLRARAHAAQQVIISLQYRIGELARSQDTVDVAAWREWARELEEQFLQAGYGETLSHNP